MFNLSFFDFCLASFAQKIYLPFRCYLINLPAAYPQILDNLFWAMFLFYTSFKALLRLPKNKCFLMCSGLQKSNIGLKWVKYFKSSRSQMFFRKDALKHFRNFTGKHREIYEFLKTSFFTEHLNWLLLAFDIIRQTKLFYP